MIEALKKLVPRGIFSSPVKERKVVEAYDIWAEDYDAQPGNLMLDLDAVLFQKLLDTIDIKNKQVADIGCGTGRHWPVILKKEPSGLTGYDVSPGMLGKLQTKFPTAKTHVITDDLFLSTPHNTYDVIVSTLTVAHIKNLEQALDTWSRILKDKGDLIITDFHPDALASGGQRTFKHKTSYIAVENYVHTTSIIKTILLKNNFIIITEEEKKVDETVKHYYEAQNALHVYDKFKGVPIIYGIHFRRM